MPRVGRLLGPGPAEPKGAPFRYSYPVDAPPGGGPVSGSLPAKGQGSAVGQAAADYASDPVLAKIRAANQALIAQAEAAARAKKKRALIAFGSPDLARQIIGDEATAQAAASNPFSTVKQLAEALAKNQRAIDETRAQQRLFYSSTRARDLSEEGKRYLGSLAKAQSNLQRELEAIDAELLALKMQLSQQETDAMLNRPFPLDYGGGWPPSDDQPQPPQPGTSPFIEAMRRRGMFQTIFGTGPPKPRSNRLWGG